MEVSVNGSRSSACHMQPSCNESVCDYKSRPSGESHHTKVYKLRPWSKLINGDSRDMVHFDETCVFFLFRENSLFGILLNSIFPVMTHWPIEWDVIHHVVQNTRLCLMEEALQDICIRWSTVKQPAVTRGAWCPSLLLWHSVLESAAIAIMRLSWWSDHFLVWVNETEYKDYTHCPVSPHWINHCTVNCVTFKFKIDTDIQVLLILKHYLD